MTTAPARLMDGTAVARLMLEHTASRAASFEHTHGRRACLATVLVGDDPASAAYVRMKQRRCDSAGLTSRHVHLPASSTTTDVVRVIDALAHDDDVDGILVQHPTPRGVEERASFEGVTPAKDVDGVTMHSFAAMAFGLPGFASCTPGGIVRLLDAYEVALDGAHAVVIGRSAILGKPMAALLLQRNATVTICHSRTVDLPSIVRSADVVVAAVGVAELVRGSWLRPGSVVVDAGYNRGNVGDVAFAEAAEVASLVTPVPGGVGPMTVALLLEQTMDAAEHHVRRKS